MPRFRNTIHRERSLRHEPLEVRTLMAASALAVARDLPPAAAHSIAAEVGPAVAGPLTKAEHQILTGKVQDEPIFQSSGYGDPPNTAPTTSGIADVTVDEDADPETISLYDAFDDAEDADFLLQYDVVGNTNYSVAYGGIVDGDLQLIFETDAYGTTDMTIRATDTGGLWVETTFTITVNPVNDAPVISGFVCVQMWGDHWALTGSVTDVDDDVEGMVVDFGGVFSSYGVSAVVQAGGTFSLTDEFIGLSTGWATAQTEDDDGALSNLAMYFV